MKRVLITGANSYIGTSFEKYAAELYPSDFQIDTIDMIDGGWKDKNFSGYDIVFHVAGIAHADVGKVTDEVKAKYYAVNTYLAIETAKKAKEDGVKQFVFMSSAIIYGDSAPYGHKKRITRDTEPKPSNFYGDSKWQADKGVRELADESYTVTVLRPPMIYGKGSKGNYPTLSRMAKKLSIFPDIKNERSMLYIENLCEFLCQVMIRGEGGIFWPQNAEYSSTSQMVREIAKTSDHRIALSKIFNPGVVIASLVPDKIGDLANKAFGNLSYEQSMSRYDFEYQKVSLAESIRRTELKKNNNRVLLIVNHDVVIYNFRLELVERLIAEGYEVHISSPAGDHTDELKRIGAHFHEIQFERHGMNPAKELKLLADYKKLINKVKPTIIFTYTIKCNIYGGIAARRARVPFCANITGLGTTVNSGGLKERLILRLYKIGLKGAQRVFFQNEANKEFMVRKGIVTSPYTVLPGSGVNVDRHMLEPYPSDENGIIITYVGRIMKDKGIDELLEAAEEIKKRHNNVTFRLIGFFDGDYEKRINQAVSDGVIEYIPQQKDIHPWMAETHALIMPSHHEGMSNVILEAASTGRPVLASDIPGCREAVDDGITGFTFAVKSSSGIVTAIEEFLSLSNDKREEMGKAGREKMEREFDRGHIVDSYMYELKAV